MLKGALISGKICTTVLFLSLILMVMLPELGEPAVRIITYVDAVFMIVSFTEYVITYIRRENKFSSLNEPTDN